MKRKNNPGKSRKKHGKKESRRRWFRNLERLVRKNSMKNTEDKTERVVRLR